MTTTTILINYWNRDGERCIERVSKSLADVLTEKGIAVVATSPDPT